MNIGGMGGSPSIQSGMMGVGVKMLNTANQAQTDMALKMLPMQAAENAGRAASEAKGMFVDTYA